MSDPSKCPSCGSTTPFVARGRTGQSCADCGSEIQVAQPIPPPPYTPTLARNELGWPVALMAVRLLNCPMCKVPMLDEMELRVNPNNNATGSMKNQLLRAGIRMPSRAQDKDDRTVCTECAPSVTFTCFGCKTERAADQIKESCGDPAEHLCKTCYSTVPASKWDELMEKLEDAHRHDYT